MHTYEDTLEYYISQHINYLEFEVEPGKDTAKVLKKQDGIYLNDTLIHSKNSVVGGELSDHYYVIVEPDITTHKKYVMILNYNQFRSKCGIYLIDPETKKCICGVNTSGILSECYVLFPGDNTMIASNIEIANPISDSWIAKVALYDLNDCGNKEGTIAEYYPQYHVKYGQLFQMGNAIIGEDEFLVNKPFTTFKTRFESVSVPENYSESDIIEFNKGDKVKIIETDGIAWIHLKDTNSGKEGWLYYRYTGADNAIWCYYGPKGEIIGDDSKPNDVFTLFSVAN